MSQNDVVEVYAAADSVEGGALVGLLIAEGIQARLVGDALGGAGGALPLGYPLSPRIWVHKSEEARARQLIGEWLKHRKDQAGDEPAFTEDAQAFEPDEPEDLEDGPGAEPDDVPGESSPADAVEPASLSPVSIVVTLVGVFCLLIGAVLAYQSDRSLKQYPATAPLTVRHQAYTVPRDQAGKFEDSISVNYEYKVGDTIYRGSYFTSDPPDERTIVRYDPEKPERHTTEEVVPSWLILALATPLGLLCLYLGRQLR